MNMEKGDSNAVLKARKGARADPFSFGEEFVVRVLGSSHGKSVGVEIEGCPAGVAATAAEIQEQLDRRRPGQSPLTSGRKEEDAVEIESGIKGGKTTGGKIACSVKNKDALPEHYGNLRTTPRPGHADYPSMVKYGAAEPGGGFFSGRMTVAFVIAGAIAKKYLLQKGVRTQAFAKSIGKVEIGREVSEEEIVKNTYSNPVRTAATESVQGMVSEVERARDEGDSVGGVVEGRITGLAPGIGQPMFGSIESAIAKAAFGIPAAKGIEFGSGFAGSALRGSQNNDEFAIREGKVVTRTNNSGGILGGLTNGMPVVFRIAFKPTSSIFKPQQSVDLKTMRETTLRIAGRHDPCIAIRAVPVVENMAAFAIADVLLAHERGKKGGKT